MNITLQMKSYREIIINEFLRRRSLDSKYTQKNFAKDIGIKYALLNKVLNGEKGISMLNAFRLGRCLGLSLAEAKEFRFLVSAQSGRSKAERTLAQQWLRVKSTKFERQSYEK